MAPRPCTAPTKRHEKLIVYPPKNVSNVHVGSMHNLKLFD